MKDRERKQLPKRSTALQQTNTELQSLLAERERALKEAQEAENALRLQVEKLRSIIEGAGDEILLVDSNGTTIYVNDRIEDIFGYTPEEVLGKSVFDLPIFKERMKEDTFQEMHRLYDEWSKGHNQKLGEIEIICKDGSTVFIEANPRPCIKGGKVESIVFVIRDISERKRYQDKLRELYEQEHRLREQIEAEMRRRIDFTRALAHELKTPLIPVLASIESLASELQDQRLLSLAQNISRGANTLGGRIDELVDLARGEIGILKLRLELIDILPMLQEVAHNMMPLASAHGQSLLMDLPRSLPAVRADPVRLKQVVTNLLDNALKLTFRGGWVVLAARDEGDNLTVEVRDTGPGLPREQQEQIFEPYHHITADKDRVNGHGLSLALCKTLVDLHGGQIWVKSSPGRGSTFGFSLPAEAAGKTAMGKGEGKLWNILIIEDDSEIVDSIHKILKEDWPQADLVTSKIGERVLELVETENPDIVILDLGLPDIDGFEVLKQIRLFSSVPVVVLAVRGEEEDIARALDLGADDYLTKPFRTKELLARLRAQLRAPNSTDGESSFICGPLRLTPSTCQLTFGRRVIGLTVIECIILQKLIRNAGHVVTHSYLAEAIWGEDYPGAMASLRTYIHRLRQKLESTPSNPKLILTKAGIGYSLVKQP